jgi:hypothetical protein
MIANPVQEDANHALMQTLAHFAKHLGLCALERSVPAPQTITMTV